MTAATEFVLTAITRDAAVIRAADAAGVDRIGIDIERLGKAERQDYAGARISDHVLDDLPRVARHVRDAALFIRVNPLHEGSRDEIERAIAAGARVIMLPYFDGPDAAAAFVDMVRGRAAAVLLVETAAAASRIEAIARLEGVAEIMVGLNDLHRGLGLASHFDVVVSEQMEYMAAAVQAAGIRFGFGGVARIDDATLPVAPDLVCAQYARLGATSAWLARSFFSGLADPSGIAGAVRSLRSRLDYWASRPKPELRDARERLAARLRELRLAVRR